MSELEMWLDKLQHMPAEDIKQMLIEEECQGERGWSYKCPLANFFKKYGLEVHVGFNFSAFENDSYDNPFTVKRFVENFDNGKYPELEQK